MPKDINDLEEYRKIEKLLNDFKNKRMTFTEAIDAIFQDRKDWLNQVMNGYPEYSVSEWLRIGKERGYDEYLLKSEREKMIKEIEGIITEVFYKLEEIEKDFHINQEIIKTRNQIINLLTKPSGK